VSLQGYEPKLQAYLLQHSYPAILEVGGAGMLQATCDVSVYIHLGPAHRTGSDGTRRSIAVHDGEVGGTGGGRQSG